MRSRYEGDKSFHDKFEGEHRHRTKPRYSKILQTPLRFIRIRRVGLPDLLFPSVKRVTMLSD